MTRQHILLLERIVLSVFLTALIVALTQKIWRHGATELPISVSFTVEAPEGTDIEVFWTEATGQSFNPKQAKNIRTRQSVEELVFPISAHKLHQLRIDIGYRPGQVILKDLSIGKKSMSPSLWADVGTYGIDKTDVGQDRLVLTSKQDDPYIVFRQPFNVNAPKSGMTGESLALLFILSSLGFALCWLMFAFLFGQSEIIESILFLLVFFVMLCLPASHINRAEVNMAENRRLAIFPKLTLDGSINRNFGREFDSWFNDRFFLRQQLVQKYNALIRLGNNVVQNRYIVVGQEGWAFSKDDHGIENYQNKTTFTDEEIRLIAGYLKQVDDWCRAHGKHFYFIIPPDKSKIYGEYYPTWIKKRKPDTESRTYKLVNYLRENTSIAVFYPREEIIAEKDKGKLLYFKNDIHWTQAGAYIAYQLMRKEMEKDYDLPVFNERTWRPYAYPKGDANILFPDAMPPDTVKRYDHPVIPIYFTIKEEVEGDPRNKYLDNPVGKYSALFMRDSFSTLLVECWFGNVFKHVTMRWRYNLTPEDFKYIEDNQIDIVVIETLERMLPKLLTVELPHNN